MFSKSKINEPGPKAEMPAPTTSSSAQSSSTSSDYKPSAPAKAKPPASILSADLLVTGNMKTTGDVQIEGQVDGDIHAHLLTVGEGATVKGEVMGDDIVIHGRIIGRVRGLKVRLTSTARIERGNNHRTGAIE